jgi:hypothetical protein
MLHGCKTGYCLKKDKEGCLHCRFYFPKDLLGFVPKYEDYMDGRGPYLVRPTRLLASAIEGAEYTDDNKITFLRNHPTLVHHNPELLTIWSANIEGRPVESYQQVVRYLLKYMMKKLSRSDSFEFVEMSKTIVKVNVMGTRRLRTPTATDTDATDLTEKNKTGFYWNRENIEGYKVAMDIHRNNSDTVRDPSKQSLYEIVRRYIDNWKMHGEDKAPHVIPSFRSVPKKGGQNKERYLMFLRALLLMHKPGSTFNQVSLLDQPQLEAEASDFSILPDCRDVVAEKHDQSQLDEEDDEEGFDGVDEQPLLVQPELEQGPHIQENWQELLGPMLHHDEPHVEDGEADYNRQDMNNEDYDWQVKTFIKSAAPSGTTAFLIGGETLHGLLYLPVSSPFQPLQESKKQSCS